MEQTNTVKRSTYWINHAAFFNIRKLLKKPVMYNILCKVVGIVDNNLSKKLSYKTRLVDPFSDEQLNLGREMLTVSLIQQLSCHTTVWHLFSGTIRWKALANSKVCVWVLLKSFLRSWVIFFWQKVDLSTTIMWEMNKSEKRDVNTLC